MNVSMIIVGILLVVMVVIFIVYRMRQREEADRIYKAERAVEREAEQKAAEQLRQHLEAGKRALKEGGPRYRLYESNHLLLCIDQTKFNRHYERPRKPYDFSEGHYWVIFDAKKQLFGDVPSQDVCFVSHIFNGPGTVGGYQSLYDALPNLSYDDYTHGGRQLLVPNPESVVLSPDRYWSCSLWDVS